MSNSNLSVYTKLSPNCTKPRNARIDTLTPHGVAGNLTIESTLDIFMSPERQASCNYTVGTDGRIGLGVNEADRAWTSSSGANDHRAITTEIANDGAGPLWHMSDKAIDAYIRLAVDICTRYGFKGVYFDSNKDAPHRNNGFMKITLHRWFSNTDCPGDYFISKIPYVVEQVNNRMTPAPAPAIPAQNGYYPYTVRVEIPNLHIRAGAGTNYSIVKDYSNPIDVNFIKPSVYTIVGEQKGAGAKLWGKLKSGAGWIALDFTKRK